MDGGGVGGWMKVGGWQLNGMRSFMCWDSTEDLCFNKRALLPVCMCICSPHRSLVAQAPPCSTFTEAEVEAGSGRFTWLGPGSLCEAEPGLWPVPGSRAGPS